MNALCPVTGKPGKRVAVVTVRSLVSAEHQLTVAEHDWFFCDDGGCQVVYFTRDGRMLGKDALKVRVGLKEKEAPRLVCYCFGHTIESIQQEVGRTGRSTVAASVREKVEAGECSCEVLNPKGTCCLGDINRVVKEAFASLGVRGPAAVSVSRADHGCCKSAAPGARSGRPSAVGEECAMPSTRSDES